jgi:hypothetical protein
MPEIKKEDLSLPPYIHTMKNSLHRTRKRIITPQLGVQFDLHHPEALYLTNGCGHDQRHHPLQDRRLHWHQHQSRELSRQLPLAAATPIGQAHPTKVGFRPEVRHGALRARRPLLLQLLAPVGQMLQHHLHCEQILPLKIRLYCIILNSVFSERGEGWGLYWGAFIGYIMLAISQMHGII